ncbi:MAG: cytochrome c5 family protein [Bermanella sp.]|nr:cytochrome c5 family protein [Bermanella sp.]|tara:strand:- start:840 stop:1133 length:294 start_codon:yes stop_codon:yes gene_type:complete
MKKLLVLTTALILSASAQAFDVEAKYNQACAACHAVGVAGAPKAFDPAAWAPKLATGMDALVASVTQGKGVMPPKGLCMDCSADQFKALINYMSKAK